MHKLNTLRYLEVGTYEGGLNIVDVDDVAQAHLQAAETGKAGERYIIGGENLTGRQLQQAVLQACGRKPIHMPFHLNRFLREIISVKIDTLMVFPRS